MVIGYRGCEVGVRVYLEKEYEVLGHMPPKVEIDTTKVVQSPMPGTVVSVLQGWKSSRWSKAMRRVHKSACGPFGTVLGPKADRYHQDHFHMDTARYRSGSYCR